MLRGGRLRLGLCGCLERPMVELYSIVDNRSGLEAELSRRVKWHRMAVGSSHRLKAQTRTLDKGTLRHQNARQNIEG